MPCSMFLAPGVRTIELAGAAETFDWLPQAPELGWHVGPRTPGAERRRASGEWEGRRVRPDDTVLLIPELSDHLPSYTWGAEARLAIRAAAIGYGLAATIHADSLDEVFESLRRAPVGLDDDELSRLGVVVILRRVDEDRRRVAATHYVRPTARDGHGHVQRLGPAVLATWDASTDTFEHFGVGDHPRAGRPVSGSTPVISNRTSSGDGSIWPVSPPPTSPMSADVRRAIDGFRTAGVAASAAAPSTN